MYGILRSYSSTVVKAPENLGSAPARFLNKNSVFGAVDLCEIV